MLFALADVTMHAGLLQAGTTIWPSGHMEGPAIMFCHCLCSSAVGIARTGRASQAQAGFTTCGRKWHRIDSPCNAAFDVPAHLKQKVCLA